MPKRRSPYRPPDLNRDHARPRTAPAPASPAVEARLTELVSPAAFALGDEWSCPDFVDRSLLGNRVHEEGHR